MLCCIFVLVLSQFSCEYPYVYPRIFISYELQLKLSGCSTLYLLLPSHSPKHLFRLYLTPAKSSNCLSWCCKCGNDLLSPMYNVVSSAKADTFISFWATVIPLMSLFFMIFVIITSARIMYNIIDSGQPCLTPVSTWKDWDRFPLILICASMLLYKASMMEIIFGPYPNFFNVFRRNFLSTLSKAFSWSNVIIDASRLLVFANEIMSLLICRFSIIVLPLTAAVCSVLIMSSREYCKRFAKTFDRIL